MKRKRARTGKFSMKKRKTAFMSVVSTVKSPEIKLVDVPLTSQNFDTNGNRVTVLNSTSQGTAETNRIGRKILMKSVMIRLFVDQFQAGTTPANDYLRCALVYDRQPNAAAAVFSDVFQDVDAAGAATTTSMSNVNISNADRFHVLRDWFWKVDVPGGTSAGNQPSQVATDFKPFSVKSFVKLGLLTHYNAVNGGTVADITSGALLLLTAGFNSSANCQYRLRFVARTRFTDS